MKTSDTFRQFEAAVDDIQRDVRLMAFPKIGNALGAARAAIRECETRSAVLMRAVDQIDGQLSLISQELWRSGVGRGISRYGLTEEMAHAVTQYRKELDGDA
jgi:hypothetical protein